MPFYQRATTSRTEYEPTNKDIMDTLGELMIQMTKIENQVKKLYLELYIMPKMEKKNNTIV